MTFNVKGINAASKVISMLDGHELTVRDNSFSDSLFENNDAGTWSRGPRVYEITL